MEFNQQKHRVTMLRAWKLTPYCRAATLERKETEQVHLKSTDSDMGVCIINRQCLSVLKNVSIA